MYRSLFRLAFVGIAVGLGPAAWAALDFSVPGSVSLSGNAGSSVPNGSLTVTNLKAGSITVSLAASSNFGLKVSPGSLTIAKGGSGTATLSVSGLFEANGNYNGSVTVSDGSGSAAVSVNLQVIGVNITVAGGSSPTIQQGKTASVSFAVSGGPSPITVSPSGPGLSGGSTNAPGSFTETISTAGLSAGPYSGTLTFSCSSGSPCLPQTMSVSFTVTAPPPSITVSPPSVSVTVGVGKTTQTPAISISGSVTAVTVGSSLQGLSGGSANSPGSFSASVGPFNSPGNLSGTLTFGCTPVACATQSVTVNITVQAAPPPVISVAPTSVNVNIISGQKTQTPGFVISGSPTSVQVSASGLGLSGGLATSPGTFAASIDASSLTPGSYPGTLTFSCQPVACLTQVVAVNLSVQPSVQLSTNKTSLTFQAYQGRPAPSAQGLGLSATGGSTTYSLQNVPSWLQVSPATGTVSGAGTGISLSVDPTRLTLGSNSASFSFVSATSSVSVNVSANLLKLSLSVNPAQASAQLAPGQTQNIPLTISTADNGGAAVTSTVATTKGGQWIKVATTSFNAPGPAPMVTLDSTGLSTGSYSGSITYSCSQLDCGQMVVPVSLTVTPPAPPAISQGGVVVASSFGGLKTVGPGTYIEIYGPNLATTTMDWSQFFVNGVAPTTLQGVGVKVNGEAAFVDYISPGQINALLPGDLSAGPAQVTVTNSLGTSTPFSVNVAPLQPTLLAPAAFAIGGKQYVGALLPPDYATTFPLPTGAIPSVPSRPAKPGETLVIYGLGFGPVTPNAPVGTVGPPVATKLNAPLQILFGQTVVTPDYAGLVASFASLYQINVQVPQVDDNDAVPLTFTLGGTTGTQTLYIAVHR